MAKKQTTADLLEDLLVLLEKILIIALKTDTGGENDDDEEEEEEEEEKPRTRKKKAGSRKKKKGPTDTEAKAAFKQVIDDCGNKEAKSILSEFDAKKFSEVKEAHYPQFIEACEEACEEDE